MSLSPLPPAGMETSWRRWFQGLKSAVEALQAAGSASADDTEEAVVPATGKWLARHLNYPTSTAISLGAAGGSVKVITRNLTVGENKRLFVTAWFVFDRAATSVVPTFEFKIYQNGELRATETASLQAGTREQNCMAFEFEAANGVSDIDIYVGSTTTSSVNCYALGTFAIIEEWERV